MREFTILQKSMRIAWQYTYLRYSIDVYLSNNNSRKQGIRLPTAWQFLRRRQQTNKLVEHKQNDVH